MFGMTVEETLILVWSALPLINNVELIFRYPSNKDIYRSSGFQCLLSYKSVKISSIGILTSAFIFKGLT